MIIDSHCHLDYPNLYDQLFNVLNRAKRNNVDNLLTICTTLESFEKDNYVNKRDARLSKQGNEEASKRVQNIISKNIKIRDIIKKLKKERA